MSLDVRKVDSGGFLRLLTTGSMVDISPDGVAAASAEEYISLISDGMIGSEDTPFTINASGDSVLLLQATQSAYVEQLGDDLTVQLALVGGDFVLTMDDNLSIGDIEVGAGVELNVGGNVVDFSRILDIKMA